VAGIDQPGEGCRDPDRLACADRQSRFVDVEQVVLFSEWMIGRIVVPVRCAFGQLPNELRCVRGEETA